MRLMQVTDLHLLTSHPHTLRGVPTSKTFPAVWERVLQEEFDLAVFTGDLAHDESTDTYDFIQQFIGQDIHRSLFLPGNHDFRPRVRSLSVCADDAESGSDPPNAGIRAGVSVNQPPMEATAAFQLKLNDWNLIGLDTQIPGEVSGRIGGEQMRWLVDILRDECPTMIFMHHPPLEIGVEWLDEIGLQNRRAFQQLIAERPHVRGIFCGHVHQEFEGRIGKTRVFTTPSTAMQFSPIETETRFDFVPPGFRSIDLTSDDFTTAVMRLDRLEFPPESDE